MRGPSLVAGSELILRCGAWAFHRGGCSCGSAQALGTRASGVVAHRLSSCSIGLEGVQASVVVGGRLNNCCSRAVEHAGFSRGGTQAL